MRQLWEEQRLPQYVIHPQPAAAGLYFLAAQDSLPAAILI